MNGDTHLDLVSHYRTQETGIAEGATQACLSGELFEGSRFESCDTVTITPQRPRSSAP